MSDIPLLQAVSLCRSYQSGLDTSTVLFSILTATLAGVTFQAWRLGNEKRDVVLLAAICGLFGAGTAVTAAV